MTLDLFDLFTFTKEEVDHFGGTYIEIVNEDQDGLLYVEQSTVDLVIETLSNQGV